MDSVRLRSISTMVDGTLTGITLFEYGAPCIGWER